MYKRQLKTQPIYINPPSDIGVFTDPSNAQEFQDYTLVRQSELDIIKNNRFVDKEILDSQTMYGNKNKPVNDIPDWPTHKDRVPPPSLQNMSNNDEIII